MPDHDLPVPLALLAEQLWHGADPDVRFELNTLSSAPAPGWTDAERYWVLPNAGRAQILLPAGTRAATAGATTNYRQLRSRRQRVARAVLGAAARAGVPASGTVLRVRVPDSRPAAADSLPLTVIAGELGADDLHAAVGIRTGANRKATLQLVHGDGRPAGYAKLGWNTTSDTYVRTETETLGSLPAGAGRARAPAVLAALEYAGHPVVVTEPLPGDVRAVRGAVVAPTSAEIHDLCPVVRRAAPADTTHLASMGRRLSDLTDTLAAPTATLGLRLLDQVRAVTEPLPVCARWHGDLAPWNCARDGTGTLWIWDWESSEPDALAGLDALHWAFSAARESARSVADIRLAACLDAAAAHLVAAGVPRSHWPTVARVYAATVIERACALAVEASGWDRVWISPGQLTALVAQASE